MNSCLLNTLLDIFRSSIFQTFFYLLAKRKWQILAAKHLQLRYLKSTSRSSAWYFKEELNQLNSITYHYIFNYYQILSIPFARATFSIPYFIPSRAEVYVSSPRIEIRELGYFLFKISYSNFQVTLKYAVLKLFDRITHLSA